MKSYDIVAYTYRADIYCPDCILKVAFNDDRELPEVKFVEKELNDFAMTLGIDRTDERSFDSDVFPKVVFADHIASDSPTFCANCHRRLN